jgi:hypothetical protein
MTCPMNKSRKDPFHLYSLSPHFRLSFNSQQGLSLSSLSDSLQCSIAVWTGSRFSIGPTKTDIFEEPESFSVENRRLPVKLGSPSRRLRTNTDYKYCIFSIVKFSIFKKIIKNLGHQKSGFDKIWIRNTALNCRL